MILVRCLMYFVASTETLNDLNDLAKVGGTLLNSTAPTAPSDSAEESTLRGYPSFGRPHLVHWFRSLFFCRGSEEK